MNIIKAIIDSSKHFLRDKDGNLDLSEWHYFSGGFSLGNSYGFIRGFVLGVSSTIFIVWIIGRII